MRLGSLKTIPQYIDHIDQFMLDTAQLVGHLEPHHISGTPAHPHKTWIGVWE